MKIKNVIKREEQKKIGQVSFKNLTRLKKSILGW